MKQKLFTQRLAPSEFRKTPVRREYCSTGDLIRANLLRKVDSPLMHVISDDEPLDKVPPSVGRVYDPFAQMIEVGKQLTGHETE